MQLDASLAEINPLALVGEGKLIAADAKINIDDNALFRHPEFDIYKEESEEDLIEAEAHRRGLQYVRLGGDIGIIGNGAGPGDGHARRGQTRRRRPANFLDIGGGAKADLVRNALEVVLSDPNVKGIFFNVFGGITRGDKIAGGIVEGARQIELRVPLVIRLTAPMRRKAMALLREHRHAADSAHHAKTPRARSSRWQEVRDEHPHR